MRGFFSVFVWVYYVVLFLLFFIIILFAFILTFPFDKYRKIPNRILAVMATLMMKASPFWSIQMEGIGNYNPSEPTIFVGNHLSFLDMALIYQLPWQMKWVSKQSLAFIPVMGWMVWLTGHLTINRSKKSALKRLSNLVQPLNDKVPVMIFPEGTRSLDGELKAFKNGAFLLAKEYDFKLQPIVVDGGHIALRSGSKLVEPKVDFKISILPAIESENFEDMKSLKEHTHTLIKKELERIRSH